MKSRSQHNKNKSANEQSVLLLGIFCTFVNYHEIKFCYLKSKDALFKYYITCINKSEYLEHGVARGILKCQSKTWEFRATSCSSHPDLFISMLVSGPCLSIMLLLSISKWIQCSLAWNNNWLIMSEWLLTTYYSSSLLYSIVNVSSIVAKGYASVFIWFKCATAAIQLVQ